MGKGNPGVITDGEGLVEAVGESIEIRGVGLLGVLGLVAVRETAPKSYASRVPLNRSSSYNPNPP